jgi:Uma2 family endonuclease
MSAVFPPQQTDLESFILRYGPVELQRGWSRETFVALAEQYPNLRMERTIEGNIIIMSPIKKGSSRREADFFGRLFMWNEQYGNGEAYGPNGTYDLPDGAIKMPDASWISPERLTNQPDEEEQYIRTVPDFVAEIRSASDRLSVLQNKMQQTWLANGVRLAWLIDPYEEKAYIYRENTVEPEIQEGFEDKTLSGEAVMPGFSLPLAGMKRRGA